MGGQKIFHLFLDVMSEQLYIRCVFNACVCIIWTICPAVQVSCCLRWRVQKMARWLYHESACFRWWIQKMAVSPENVLTSKLLRQARRHWCICAGALGCRGGGSRDQSQVQQQRRRSHGIPTARMHSRQVVSQQGDSLAFSLSPFTLSWEIHSFFCTQILTHSTCLCALCLWLYVCRLWFRECCSNCHFSGTKPLFCLS